MLKRIFDTELNQYVNVEMTPAEEAEFVSNQDRPAAYYRELRINQLKSQAAKVIQDSLFDPAVAGRVRAKVAQIEAEINAHPSPRSYSVPKDF